MACVLRLHNGMSPQCRHAASAWLAVTNCSSVTGGSIDFWAFDKTALALWCERITVLVCHEQGYRQ